jgi:AraC family transcriptional regulator
MHAHEKSKIGKEDRKPGQEGDAGSGYVPDVQNDPRTLRRRSVMASKVGFDVRVEAAADFHVAYVRHIGPYQGDAELFKALFGRLLAWAGPRGLVCPPETRFLTVYHDDPNITEPSKLRTSVCISVPADTAVSGEIGKMVVPAGRYARLRFELHPTEYQAAWEAVYGSWLPESGYQPADGPPYEQYLNDATQHPEGKAIVEICLPVKPL